MKRFYISRLIIIAAILLGWNAKINAQTIVYNQSFVSGGTPTTQCTAWTTFLASLLASYNYTGFNISGSLNPTGYTCTSATVAASVAAAMRTGTVGTFTSDGHTWYVGTGCGGGCGGPIVELAVDQGTCTCGSVASVRPAINNNNWGGLGTNCGAASQTLIVTFFYQALLFTATSPQSLSVCQNSTGNTLNASLSTTDPTAGRTETWSVSTAALHGTLGGFPVSATTTTGTLTPGGSLTYTPTAGYSGVDSFKIQATDGTSTAIMKYIVTVNPTPAAITGRSCVVQGLTSSLGDASPSGVWSSSNTGVATVTSGGLVSGVSVGTAIVSYIVGSICPATTVVSVNTTPGPISGVPSVCTGSLVTLSDGSVGGTWFSSNTAAATVDGAGNVSGVASGATNITYTLPSTCAVSVFVTVNSAPGPILGTASVCVNGTTSLVDVITGGVWTSSAGGIATVDGSGNVGGASQGTSNIIYTLSTGCSATRNFTVNALPTPFVVSGTKQYCAGDPFTTPILLNNSTVGISYQLYNGTTPINAPIAGTGGPLNFGTPPSTGTYTVIGTNTVTGCTNQMALQALVTIKALPVPFTVTEAGSGSYCQGGAGIVISLSSSATGVGYQLYSGGTPVPGMPTIPGNGLPISFPPEFSAGTYTIVGTTSGPAPNCASNMSGSVPVTINPLPDPETITVSGGGVYCPGSGGVAIGLQFSGTGISYQLFNGGDSTGSPVLGTGGPITFGLQTTPGSSYTVIATNTSTGCFSNMPGSVSVTMATPPAQYNVTLTGDGAGCVGVSTPTIGLDNSDGGVSYQLYNGALPVGVALPGVSGPLSFGVVTATGNYTVIATDETYHCTSTMFGSAVINLAPSPIVYNVTGGGSYCASGTGLSIMLDGSQAGITYTLSTGGFIQAAPVGTGGPITFGTSFTTAGVYTVVASSAAGCISNMAGSAVISINPLPIPYPLDTGGSYCAGGAGIDIVMPFSATGINYQLYNGATGVGASLPGTGDTLNFGYKTVAGTYTVVGRNPITGCVSNMASSATIRVNALPGSHTITGGGSYCAGGTGKLVNLNGSNPGITYQLYNNLIATGSAMAGTGSPISFGLQTVAGTYTIVGTDTTTQCTNNMAGAATVVVNLLPGLFTVTGGGSYCEGGTGAHIGLTGSNSGVHYLLSDGATLESTVTGTGSALDFGLQTTTGTYTVTAANISTGCTNAMTGNAIVATNLLPISYAVIGGGNYCTGAAVIPSLGLAGSDAGINYQLYHGSAAIGAVIAGTGAALDFGTHAAAGAYTIVGTNTTTGCVKTMSGSASVVLNPLPAIYTVTGGGSYCAGDAGSHIYVSSSTNGIQYILYKGATVIDTITGTGAGVDFGLQTAAGGYTALAVNPATGCTSNMTGSATIIVNTLPAVHTITVADGGNYCVTGSGVHIGLDGSNGGVSYQLYNGFTPVGAAIGGIGTAIDFGIHTAGNYTITGTAATTGCKSSMTGSARVNAIPLPNAYTTTGGGNYCTTGLGLHIGISGSDSGTQYQLYHGASPVGIPITGLAGSPVDFGLFTGAGTYTVVGSNGGSLGCNNTMSGSAVIAVYPVIIPAVSIATAGGDTACVGVTTNLMANVINGGTSPTFTWSINGIEAASGSTYSYVPVDGDIVTVMVHSNGICAIPDTGSQTIRLTVSPPELPSVSVLANPGNIVCQGTSVSYTASPLYGGSHPTYEWLRNGVNTGVTSPTYTYTPANHDIIVLLMGSDFPCRLSDTVFSNPTSMEVDPPVIPRVSITVNPGTKISAGQNATLTVSVINGGSAPKYQWFINGVAVNGATNTTFNSSTLANNDSVTCEVIGSCDLQGFNSVRIHVGAEGVQQVTAAGTDNIKLVPNPNKGSFMLKGALATTGNEEVSVEVVNMLGQVVYSNKIVTQSGSINESIQLSGNLANGMYILNLRSGTQNSVFHFVIEQ